MTFRDKLTQEHPDAIDSTYYQGGCKGCPKDYGYEEGTRCEKYPTKPDKICTDCWNREMPDTEEKKEGYEQGLNDAWEFLKKVHEMGRQALIDAFDNNVIEAIIDQNTPQEAFAKLQAYEEEQNKIEVGDVVICDDTDEKAIVVCKCSDGKYKILFGDFDIAKISHSKITKTGKHIDIQQILSQIGGE